MTQSREKGDERGGVVPASFTNFLLASAGASAALIGLLFVAVSLEPAQIFGPRAIAEHQAAALSAFTALSNAFFVSLGGLIPTVPIGAIAAVAGIIAAGQTLTLVRLWPQWRRERRLRAAVLFLGSAVLYGDELWTAWRLVGHTMDTDALSTLCALLLGAYAVGLGRAWELLGARSGGLVTGLITTWLAARRSSDRAGDEAPRQDSIPKGPEPEVDGEP